MEITLLYQDDCPNVEPTRVELRAALEAHGLSPAWDEIDLGSPEGEPFRGHASPTILIDGQDLAGVTPGEGPACRMYSTCCGMKGYPSRDLIRSVLREPSLPGTGRWIPAWVAGFSLASILVPAGLCPACWPAYLSVLSGLGLGALAARGLLGPLAGIILLLGVIPLGFYLRRHGSWESWVAAGGGVFLVFLSRRLVEPGLGVLGAILLVLSALVAIRTSRRGSSSTRTRRT